MKQNTKMLRVRESTYWKLREEALKKKITLIELIEQLINKNEKVYRK